MNAISLHSADDPEEAMVLGLREIRDSGFSTHSDLSDLFPSHLVPPVLPVAPLNLMPCCVPPFLWFWGFHLCPLGTGHIVPSSVLDKTCRPGEQDGGTKEPQLLIIHCLVCVVVSSWLSGSASSQELLPSATATAEMPGLKYSVGLDLLMRIFSHS